MAHSARFWMSTPWLPTQSVSRPLAASQAPTAVSGSSGNPVTRLLRMSMRTVMRGSARMRRRPQPCRRARRRRRHCPPPRLPKRRRAGHKRARNIDHRRQHLVIDIDKLGRVERSGTRRGHDQRHAFTGVPHLVERERIVGRRDRGPAAPHQRQVGRGPVLLGMGLSPSAT